MQNLRARSRSLGAMIEINGLTKKFGANYAANDVSFTCQPGTVTGFLGPNGAGKSTTMRVLSGLASADAGTATVLGKRFVELPNPARRVGVLLDASAQHPGLRGREVLRQSSRMCGVDPDRADELLAYVGLGGGAGEKRVREYSLGMRQRLGIANALVGDPEVLILDEPANGLDPVGIRWMRSLLRDFADRGGTVLLSSHLLTEVEAVADRLVIIGSGRIVADAPTAELLAGSGTVVRAADFDALVRAIGDAGLEFRASGDFSLTVNAEPETVGSAALAAGVALSELTSGGADLEELFFALTDDSDPIAQPVQTTKTLETV